MRIHTERPRTLTEWRKHRHYFGDSPRARQPGRARKKKLLDCGNPQCHLCHSDKFPRRELTRAEAWVVSKLRAYRTGREGLTPG